MSIPVFSRDGYELCDSPDTKIITDTVKDLEKPEAERDKQNIYRAVRRAKVTAFDLILANPSLDTFTTLTYDPERVDDRASYDDCYGVLKPWLSNRVQRNNLQYIICPERHAKGGIHLHMIANKDALTLTPAIHPLTFQRLTHGRNPLWNVKDWKYGFSSSEVIKNAQDDREAVAKYIFKYMGKNMGAKIGGRYFLHGGNLRTPVYEYANDVTELCDVTTSVYSRKVDTDCGVTYTEWSFV